LKKGFSVEVINAGVQGWYSYNDYLRIEKEIINYDADIILLHQGWNEEFEYSSLQLGKNWSPRRLRSLIEANYYYNKNRINFNQIYFYVFFVFKRLIMKKFVFNKLMSFDNPNRFRVLLKNEYLVAWRDNIAGIAELCKKKNITLFTLNYPGLPTLGDSRADRDLYIQKSRLSENYAIYQSISKYRITKFLQKISPFIPNIDIEKPFEIYSGEKRLELFIDEIHLSEKGNDLFAKNLAVELSSYNDFKSKFDSNSKVSLNNGGNLAEFTDSQKFYELPRYMRDIVEQKIGSLATEKSHSSKSIPTDRYTTH
jgi:hypothetical protein